MYTCSYALSMAVCLITCLGMWSVGIKIVPPQLPVTRTPHSGHVYMEAYCLSVFKLSVLPKVPVLARLAAVVRIFETALEFHLSHCASS